MRWDAQKIDAEAERSLPGLETERVRTFDAPEALDTRFHEGPTPIPISGPRAATS